MEGEEVEEASLTPTSSCNLRREDTVRVIMIQ